MKTVFKTELKSKTYCVSKRVISSREKEISLVNIKFYQKLFVISLLLSTFLIIPESPRELENICNNYNSRELCNIW